MQFFTLKTPDVARATALLYSNTHSIVYNFGFSDVFIGMGYFIFFYIFVVVAVHTSEKKSCELPVCTIISYCRCIPICWKWRLNCYFQYVRASRLQEDTAICDAVSSAKDALAKRVDTPYNFGRCVRTVIRSAIRDVSLLKACVCTAVRDRECSKVRCGVCFMVLPFQHAPNWRVAQKYSFAF